ncbi:hypothetical protein A2U01_0072670, partial [Trifolium medium]|nr:hypothetical protein [Trifolium medium]
MSLPRCMSPSHHVVDIHFQFSTHLNRAPTLKLVKCEARVF